MRMVGGTGVPPVRMPDRCQGGAVVEAEPSARPDEFLRKRGDEIGVEDHVIRGTGVPPVRMLDRGHDC